ncbi:MAG: hypothetical protein ACE5GC_05745, partial [Acidimicrobiia bacterium]
GRFESTSAQRPAARRREGGAVTARAAALRGHRRLAIIEGREEERPRLQPWLLLVLCVVVAFFGLIVSRISLDRSAFHLEELEQRIVMEEAHHWDLRLEAARLQDPERIAALAAEMGLVYPDERMEVDAPPVDADGVDPEYRWAQLKTLLSAQP